MSAEAERRWEAAKKRLLLAEIHVLSIARVIADDYRKGYVPDPETTRRLCALSDDEVAAQKEVHDAGEELIAALEPRKARA